MKLLQQSTFVKVIAAACGIAAGALSAQAQTYTPSAWVNDPFTTNANWLVLGPNTPTPTYTNINNTAGNNLYGFSPIGATIGLTNIGDAALLTEQVTLAGNVIASANVQYRLGMYYKGASANDVGWMGYQIGEGNTLNGGGGQLYLLNTNNTQQFANGGAATQPGNPPGTLGAGAWGAATYDFKLTVTKLGANSTLVKWSLAGQSPNTFLYAGRFTNNSVATQGGFLFDQVGFLKGGSVFNNGTGNTMSYSNVLVTVGQFSDGVWTNDANGVWSAGSNWTNGIVANAFGFVADFSQVNLTADRTITLDSPRTIGSLGFGTPSGLNNWSLNASGGNVLTLDSGVPGALGLPVIAVNQNTTTINLPLVSSNGLAKTGAGTLVLRGTNNLIGPLNLNGGALNFLSLSNLPFNATISAINFGGGALQWAAGNTFDITSPAIPINFIGTAGFDTGPNNVGFANGFGNGGAGGLTKLGSGTLTLTNAAFYTGATTISNGVLALTSAGSLPSTTRITVLAGATLDVSANGLVLNPGETLAGTGTVLGNVSDNATAIIAPGTSAGTLTVNGNLTLNGGGILNYELSDVTTAGSGVNDLTVVSGNLNIAGPTTLNVALVNGAPGLGVYTLFTYNTFSGSVANLSVPLGFSVTNDTAAKIIGLVVSHIPATLTWRGDGTANVWDTGTTTNWIQSGSNQFFFTGDTVTFDDTGFNSPPINLAATESPAAVTVNATQDYNLYSVTAGGINSGRLTKSGTGTLTLETDNTYSGPTVINAGVLQVGGPNLGGANGTLGTGPTTNNAALIFNRSADYTYTNVVRGTGSITNIGPAGTVLLSGGISGGVINMAGSGTMALSGSNSYTGLTIVSSGSLNPRNSAALGTTAAGTVISNAARLYLDANIDILGESVSVAGTGPDGAGALRKGGNGISTFSGAVSLTADASISVDGGSTLNLTNAGGIAGSGFNLTLAGAGNGTVSRPITLGIGSLTKTDGGTWTIASTNNYTGKTFINGGILAIPAATALGTAATFTPDFVTLNGGSLGVTTNVTIADGLRGFTASGSTGGFNVAAGFTLVISNEITGVGAITKINAGTVVLRGSNSFSGTLNVDNNVNAGDDGILVVAHPYAISAVLSPIAIRDNLGASSILQLDGSSGNINLSQDFTVNGRSPATPAIQSVSGNNTLAGTFQLNGGGIRYIIQSDSGLLTLNGNISSASADPLAIGFQGNGNITATGVISDGTNVVGITKSGNGSLTLTGVNTYTDQTTVNGGALRGTGTIAGPVSISSGGTLAPGTSAVGTLTINNTLTLAGTTSVKLNKLASTSDQVVGLTTANYGGTLTVTNLAGTLLPGDTFTLFSAASRTGNFASVVNQTGNGAIGFSFNPTSGVLSVISGVATNPTNITAQVVNNQLDLSWPADHTGWTLQTNAVSLIATNAWFPLPGSTGTNHVILPINPGSPSVFFRLVYP